MSIDCDEFVNNVQLFFSFLKDEYGMIVIDKISRKNIFHSVRYENDHFLISISYECIENYFNVQLIRIINGKLSSYDDVVNSYSLDRLYALITPYVDNKKLYENTKLFDFHINNEIQKKILKSAKKLRICLQYIDML